VWLDAQREHVISIIGKRGSGKSYTLGCIAESLAADSGQIVTGRSNRASLLFDTINIFWTMGHLPEDQSHPVILEQRSLLEQWKLEPSHVSVDFWSPAGFDVPGTDFPKFSIMVSDLEASDWCYLLGYDMIRDLGGQLISEALDKVGNSGWTWATRDEQGNVLSQREMKANKAYSIEELIECVQHDLEITSPSQGFATQTRRAVINSLRVLSRYELFARDGTDLHELLRPGRMTVLLLGMVPNDIRAAIVSVLIKKALKVRAETSYYEKKIVIETRDKDRFAKIIETGIPKITVLIDEAQNLLPSTMKTLFNEIVVKLVREGRNYGISVILTTQQPSALDPRVMAQVDTLIVHRLASQQDIQYVLQNLKSALPDEISRHGGPLALEDLIRELPVGYAVISSTDAQRAFVAAVRPRVTLHGGFEL